MVPLGAKQLQCAIQQEHYVAIVAGSSSVEPSCTMGWQCCLQPALRGHCERDVMVPREAYKVLLYYSYSALDDPDAHAQWQTGLCDRLNLRGRIRVAREGINGTVSGTADAVRQYMEQVDQLGLFPGMQWKVSPSEIGHAFPSMVVSLRDTVGYRARR